MNCVRSKDAHKQLVPTSLKAYGRFDCILPVPNVIGNGHLPYLWGRRGREGMVGSLVGGRQSEDCFFFTNWLVGAFD